MPGYNKIISYLKQKDNFLYKIIKELHIEELLVPKNRDGGVTFLRPINESVRKQLYDLVFSGDGDKMDLASKKIAAMILRTNLKSHTNFFELKEALVNSLSQRVELTNISGTSIIFKGGAKCKIDNDFVDGSKSKKLAVWLLDGELPIDAPKIKRRRAKKNEPEEIPHEPKYESQALRLYIANSVENMYISQRVNRNPNIELNKYLEIVCSFIWYLANNDYCKELFENKIAPLVSFNIADFYLIFEPYKSTNYTVPIIIINEWYKNYEPANIATVYKWFESYLNSRQSDALYIQDPEDALDKVADARAEITDGAISKQTLGRHIKKQYLNLVNSNILPQAFFSRYGDPLEKLYEDELRFVIFTNFLDIERDYQFDRNKFDNIVNIIKNATEDGFYSPILTIDQKSPLMSKSYIRTINVFLNSTMFFYFPLSDNSLKDYPQKTTLNPRESNDAIYFTTEIIKRPMRTFVNTRFTQDTDDVSDLVRKIKEKGKLDSLKAIINSLD